MDIHQQHMAYLQRQAERASFLQATLEARLTWTPCSNVKAFIEETLAGVNESYPTKPFPEVQG